MQCINEWRIFVNFHGCLSLSSHNLMSPLRLVNMSPFTATRTHHDAWLVNSLVHCSFCPVFKPPTQLISSQCSQQIRERSLWKIEYCQDYCMVVKGRHYWCMHVFFKETEDLEELERNESVQGLSIPLHRNKMILRTDSLKQTKLLPTPHSISFMSLIELVRLAQHHTSR